MKKRWVILRHTLLRDTLDGLHFDLLVEDQTSCRSWRLDQFPVLNGPLIAAKFISPHNLYWLDRDESPVSGNRGWAKRVAGGTFMGSLPSEKFDCLLIEIHSNDLSGLLKIENHFCQLLPCT